MERTKFIKQIISGKHYLSNHMEKMDRECAFYMDQILNAKNTILRKAYGKIAIIYFKRYEYYFKKQFGHGLRERI